MYRLWIGANEGSLQRGPLYQTLQETLKHGYALAVAYRVKIELGSGEWHTFAETGATAIGPGFGREPAPEPELAAPEPLLEDDFDPEELEPMQLPEPDTFSAPGSFAGPPRIDAGLGATLDVPPLARGTVNASAPTIADVEPEPDRRQTPRLTSPLPDTETRSVTWNGEPVRLLDVSWTGARVETRPRRPPRAGATLVVEVRAFGLIAQLVGRVRWMREGECGIAFEPTLMTRSSTVLLDRLLGELDAD
jgi:hypothetical protein